jgi:hypothetical protein
MISIGIDPGKHGAVGIIWQNGEAEAHDLTPSHADNVALLREVIGSADGADEILVTIESVHAMPKQGVSSSFDFGQTFGVIIGALYALGVPFQLVSPAKWKGKVFDSSPRGKEQAEQKTAARDLARRLFPGLADSLRRVKDADRAEAVLMAEYGRRVRGKGVTRA